MSEKAIVIEDDQMLNESLSELLELMGINVIGQGFDGEDAVRLFTKNSPDYSLVDLSMPKFDGFYALEQIRIQDPKAIVFVVTGDTTSETKKRLEKLNATGIIYKPFKIEDVVEKLRFAKSSLRTELAA